MEAHLRFVARLLDGVAMTEVCREFGISRNTGYKIFDHYKEQGLAALSDRSRRPVRYANHLPDVGARVYNPFTLPLHHEFIAASLARA